MGVLVGASVIRAAPALDPRWQTVGVATETPLLDRLTRSERAALLFVGFAVLTDAGRVATHAEHLDQRVRDFRRPVDVGH